MYSLKSGIAPSFALILMGSIDCLTTVIGILYFGAVELNPVMAGIVSTNILAFVALKISATFFIGFTFIIARSMLNKTTDKQSRSFKYSNAFLKVAYLGLLMFLTFIVVNNFMILIP